MDTTVTEVDRDASGIVTRVATPAAILDYTHADPDMGDIDLDTSGFITEFTLYTTGPATGFVKDRKGKDGTGGSTFYLETLTYDTSNDIEFGSAETCVTRPFVSSRKDYHEDEAGSGDAITWSFATTCYTSTLAVEKIVTTEPAIATGQNGSGTANTTSRYFRKDGTLAFAKDQDGIISYREYTDGLLTESIDDADTSVGSTYDLTPPPGFTSSGTELHHVTTRAYTEQGRLDTVTGPDSIVSAHYVSHLKDRRLVSLAFPKYVSGSPGTYYGPVQCSVTNLAGHKETAGTIDLVSTQAATSGHVDETDEELAGAVTSLGDLHHLHTSQYSSSGVQLESSRVYFDTPTSLPGSTSDYDETEYVYDDLGRRTRVDDPTSTKHKTIFDIHGKPKTRWIGTVDGGGGDNMVKTEEFAYSTDNRHTTSIKQYTDASSFRETKYVHDYRGRVLTEERPEKPHLFYKYDNHGRVLATGAYSTVPASPATKDPTTYTTNRIGLIQSAFDDMGRVYETKRHKVASNGTYSSANDVEVDRWYDPVWQLVKVDGSQLMKYDYDRLERKTHAFTLASVSDSSYADVDDLVSDKVLLERQAVYGEDSNNVVMRARISRDHDDTTTTGALDTNADADVLKYTDTNINGRIQVTAFWHDDFGRVTDEVEYGTFGGATFDRDGRSIPARSDTELRVTYTYTDAGQLKTTEDPMGVKRLVEYDDQGRETRVVDNYDPGVNSGQPSGTEDNQSVKFTYTNGLLATRVVDLPGASNDQSTAYGYGTNKATSDSEITTGHLLSVITYPTLETETFAYNAQEEQTHRNDRAGNAFVFTFDDAGRVTSEDVTVASGFDTAIDLREWSYTDRGQVAAVKELKDNADPTPDTVKTHVKFTYDDWGVIEKVEQDHEGEFNGGSNEYTVSYGYELATGGRNVVRRTSMTYPSTTALTYDYSTGSLHDTYSRVERIKEGASTRVRYEYQGTDMLVYQYYDEPDVFSSYYNLASKALDNLDRFNRLGSVQWTKDLTTDVDFYDVDYGFDRNSFVTLTEDNILPGFDVDMTRDSLNRLTRAKEGTWNGSTITSLKRDEEWALNLADVMTNAKLDLNGDGDYVDTDERNDGRTWSKSDELTARTDPSASLAHDGNGNITDDGTNYKYTYDAWNRLVKIRNRSGGEATVREYAYNGLDQLIKERENGTGDRDYWVYDAASRKIATNVGTASTPLEEFFYHQDGPAGLGRAGNRVLKRTKGSDTHYYCHNPLKLVTIINKQGALIEWIKYTSYGVPIGIPGYDIDTDFDCDGNDVAAINAYGGPYNVVFDGNLDGVINGTDATLAAASYQGTTLGYGSLSSIDNRRGLRGYVNDDAIGVFLGVSGLVYSTDTSTTLQQRQPSAWAVDGVGGGNGPVVVEDQEFCPPDYDLPRAPGEVWSYTLCDWIDPSSVLADDDEDEDKEPIDPMVIPQEQGAVDVDPCTGKTAELTGWPIDDKGKFDSDPYPGQHPSSAKFGPGKADAIKAMMKALDMHLNEGDWEDPCEDNDCLSDEQDCRAVEATVVQAPPPGALPDWKPDPSDLSFVEEKADRKGRKRKLNLKWDGAYLKVKFKCGCVQKP